MKKLAEILLNLIFWLVSFWVILRLVELDLEEVEIIIDNGQEVIQEITRNLSPLFYLGGVFKALLFYAVVFWLVPIYFSTQKLLRFVLYLCGAILFFLSVELLPLLVLDGRISTTYLLSTVGAHGFYLAVGLAYGIIRKQWKLDSERQQLTNERLRTELKLLRSQINPHFLFNALNNLLAISERSGTSVVSDGITKLSGLLRFLIYETQTDFIPLQKEIDFIEAYLALHALRYRKEDAVEVRFTVLGIKETHRIAPALLIPFVENAFKHGIKAEQPSFIHIRVEALEESLVFEVQNSTHEIENNEFTTQYAGVGLDNVRKRLKLIYPNRYNLTIDAETTVFNIVLRLEL